MARETAAEKQFREALEQLPEIVKATKEGGFVYTDFLVHSPLQLEGLVEINEDFKNEKDEVATRATEKGIEKVMSENVETVTAAPKYAIVDVPLPKTVRAGGTRTPKYPFGELEIGNSFFVEGCTAKGLASSVNLAMKKYDVPDIDENGVQKTKKFTVPRTGEKRTIGATKHTRVFKVVDIEDGKDYGFPGVKGAAIGRTA